MIQEREDTFERLYGFRGNAIRTEGFLTYERLAELRDQLALHWELFRPWYGVRPLLKPGIARLRGTREPARFGLVIGHRRSDF